MWRSDTSLTGPTPAKVTDIDALNRVFSEAFTDRYRRDGLAGVRVPYLNPAIWRFAIEDADQGAMTWRDARGDIVAFNMVHRSGSEGWMGPLAVRSDRQGHGHGQQMVRAGVEWLKSHGVRTIGLETMPRTIDNIGFYSHLGFIPNHLTVTVQRDRPRDIRTAGIKVDSATSVDRAALIAECRVLSMAVVSGVDFSREIQLTLDHQLGGLSLLRRDGALCGFALWHTAPLAQGRTREELRVLKLVGRTLEDAMTVVSTTESETAALGLGRIAIRCQTSHADLYAALIEDGFRVHWTDLRMTVSGHAEQERNGIMLSNWEI